MIYKEAILDLINRYGREVLKDNFKTRAILSDLVGCNIRDSRLVGCFCWLNEGVALLDIYEEKNDIKQYRKIIIAFYKKEKPQYTIEEVKASVNPLTALLYGEDVNKQNVITLNDVNAIKKKQEVEIPAIYGTRLSNCKRLVIKCGKGNTTIGYSDSRLFNIVANNKNINLAKITKINNENFIVNLRGLDDNVLIKVPRKAKISTIDIDSDSSFISCERRIDVKEVNIKSNSNVSWYGKNKKLKIVSDGSTYVICSEMNEIDILSQRDISYYLDANTKKVNLKCHSLYGNIRGSFVNGRTCPRVIPWLSRTKRVLTTSWVKGTAVHYDLNAPHGCVRAK